MTRYALHWGLISIFALSIIAAGYFALQLRRSQPPPPANFLAADKGYGVTIDLTQYDDATLIDTLAAMRQNGLTWLRQPVSWANIETAPGQYNWQPLDRLFSNLPPHFKLIVVLRDTPAWARPSGSTPTAPPTHLSDFGNFTRAFAARYGQQVDYYQIWHEPNLSAGWGDAFVDASAYADLLREASLNIRAADPAGHILTAALAATLEDGPLNLNELTYLERLYQARAAEWFDIVAIQPMGLWAKPLDPPDPNRLNFRRAELVRRVMRNHGDADTPIWITAFGWVALPADWAGRLSPWSNDLPAIQTPRTAAAIAHARQHWPWLGPMLAVRWDAAGLPADDPARGLALLETPSILAVIQAAAAKQSIATAGYYPATHPVGIYSSGWRFALTRADIPRRPPQTLTIPFEGARLDLNIERGLFRGYLWITIDGQPANALPQNGQGQSYVVLYDPLRQPASVTLAQHLPAGQHTAVITADGGWGQWAITGWSVYNLPDTRQARTGLMIAGAVAVVSGLGMLRLLVSARADGVALARRWSAILVARSAAVGERGQIGFTVALAAAIYLAQGAVGLALLPLLALMLLLRPDVGLALITAAIFFFQTPLRLPAGSFSPVEALLALSLAGVVFRGLVASGRIKFTNLIFSLKSTDWAALALVMLAFLSTLTADNFAVALREWRTVVVEPVIFYFLVRLGLDFSSQSNGSSKWAYRLVDGFVAGAALQAIFSLYFYFFTDSSIDAEGVHRALGLGYGSPNNLALMLGRAWPILLAVTALPGLVSTMRRGAYAAGLLVVSLALYLTFSKGALLVGLPACVVVMTLLYGLHRWPHRRPRVIGAAACALAAFALALIPFSQTERFRATFDFGEGSTAFFRVKLWQASWAMLKDYWPLGVGPDNFLYQYRTRYILPEAWQEPDLNHPHNLFLDFGTRLGLGGIVLLLWLQVVFWRNAWRWFRLQFDPLVLGLMGSMVVFVAHGLVDNSYFLTDLAFAFFLVAGITQRQAEAFESL